MLAPPDGVLENVELGWISATGASVDDRQFVEALDDGAELHNVTFTLDVTITALLREYRPPRRELEALGVVPLAYSPPEHAEVRLPVQRVRLEVAGLLDRGNDDSWEQQQVLDYVWL